jgi:hypothetical protein
MPHIALILYIGFVFLLLWLDRKQDPEASKVLWIPTSWMLIVSSRPVGSWLGQDPGDASPFDQFYFISLAILAFFTLARRKFSYGKMIRENKLPVFILVFMLISILWTDDIGTSFKRWFREVIAFLMACMVVSESNPKEAVITILRRISYILVPLSLILIKYFPAYGRRMDRRSSTKNKPRLVMHSASIFNALAIL